MESQNWEYRVYRYMDCAVAYGFVLLALVLYYFFAKYFVTVRKLGKQDFHILMLVLNLLSFIAYSVNLVAMILY